MRRLAALLFLAIAAAGCANTSQPAPPATQAPAVTPSPQQVTDDTYYSWLVAKNLTPATSDREQELRRAHAVCDNLDAGMQLPDLVAAMPLGYTDSVSNRVIAAAVKTYCPEHRAKLTV